MEELARRKIESESWLSSREEAGKRHLPKIHAKFYQRTGAGVNGVNVEKWVTARLQKPLRFRFPFCEYPLWSRHKMTRRDLMLVLILAAAGCETTGQDRAREFRQDGLHLFRQGNYQGARESFALALEVQPGDASLLYNLGQCSDRLADTAKAEQYYRECLEVAPNHADCRYALASMLYRTGNKADAQRMIQDWLARQTELADAYALDGWRLRQDNNLPDAQGRLH